MIRTAAILIALLVTLAPSGIHAETPEVIDLWPGQPPGKDPLEAEESVQPPRAGETPPVQRVTNVRKPTLKVFRPAKDKDCGAAVVIAPGGAYNILAWDKEGEEVARWLNTLGVTGCVLKYRVPRRAGEPSNEPPSRALQDGQRAVRLVRSRAKDWGIDPKRVGMLGFSAGGHLTAATATGHDGRRYEPVDDIDQVSSRPDFVVLVYPAYLVTPKGDGLLPTIKVNKQTPPMFLAHAADDRVAPENSVQMFLALKRAGVPAELHVYSRGGHGFGLRPSDRPVSHWPERCAEWMRDRGLLEKGATP